MWIKEAADVVLTSALASCPCNPLVVVFRPALAGLACPHDRVLRAGEFSDAAETLAASRGPRQADRILSARRSEVGVKLVLGIWYLVLSTYYSYLVLVLSTEFLRRKFPLARNA